MVGLNSRITTLLLVLALIGSYLAIVQPVEASVENVPTSATITIYPEPPVVAGQAVTVVAQLYPPPPQGEVYANLTVILIPAADAPPFHAGPYSSDEKGVAWFTFNINTYEGTWFVYFGFDGQYFANNTLYYQRGSWQKSFSIISAQTPSPSPTATPSASPTASPTPTMSPTPTPEFSPLTILPLLISVLSVAVILRYRKTNKPFIANNT